MVPYGFIPRFPRAFGLVHWLYEQVGGTIDYYCMIALLIGFINSCASCWDGWLVAEELERAMLSTLRLRPAWATQHGTSQLFLFGIVLCREVDVGMQVRSRSGTLARLRK